MSTPNPTQVIAEGMREVATEGQKGTPGTREDGQLWGAFPNTMTLTDLAAHVVSKLTDAGYSIVPTPRVIHNQEEFDELPVRTWLRDSDGWVCQIGDDAESDPEWMAYPATVIWTPAAAAEGEKP